MDVKIPAFDLKISKLWAIMGILWSVFLVLITYYVNSRIAEYRLQHSIEKNSEAVSSFDTTFRERRVVVDSQLSGLRTDVGALQNDMIEVKAKLDNSEKNQSRISEQLSDVQKTLTALTAAIIQQDRIAGRNVPAVHSVRYEVRP